MTGEDRACVALLFCATFGVGSMSFGSTFAAAGPLLASLSVYFLSACNLHARYDKLYGELPRIMRIWHCS
jgi:hypothetical protein